MGENIWVISIWLGIFFEKNVFDDIEISDKINKNIYFL